MPKPALTYLTRRGNVYWFRMAVPSDLVERLGRREVKASLGTSSLAAARQRCQHLGSAVLQFIARIRSMPELSQETIKRLLEIDPEILAIVSSGYANDPVMSRYQEYGFSGMIAKPYEIDALGRKVAEVLAQPRRRVIFHQFDRKTA